MLIPGLCTVTFKNEAIEKVVTWAEKAGLSAIECAAVSHVEPGDFKKAENIKSLCESNGIEIPSYGSYYKVGVSNKQGQSFELNLETALRLGCENIRVWAGDRDFGEASNDFIKDAVKDTFRIAEMADKKQLTISFEFHKGSLTDTNKNALRFAELVNRKNVKFYWQPPNGMCYEYCMDGLVGLNEKLGNLHVFHWTVGSPYENKINSEKPLAWPDDYYRHKLSEGKEVWKKYLNYANRLEGKRFCFLEFVKDDSFENLIQDAQTLKDLINSVNK